jgi:hypothetical protein
VSKLGQVWCEQGTHFPLSMLSRILFLIRMIGTGKKCVPYGFWPMVPVKTDS